MKLLRTFFSLSAPYWLDRRNWLGWVLLASLLGLGMAIVQINVVINEWTKTFYDTLSSFDVDAFYVLIGQYVLYIALFVVLVVYKAWLRKALLLRWRQAMSERMIGEWMADHVHYRLGLHGEPDNPDQRIAEDIRLLVTHSVDLLVSFVTNLAQVVAFASILWTLSGSQTFEVAGRQWHVEGYLFWVAVLYTVIGTLCTHALGRPLHRLNYEHQQCEADFRADLLRKREHAEQIAFYDAQAVEKRQLKRRFNAIARNWRSLMARERNLGFFTVGYDRLSRIVPVFVALPLFLAKTITLGGLMQVRTAFGAVQGSLSWFIDAYTLLAEWTATVERLGQFQQAMQRSRRHARTPHRGPGLILQSLTIQLPNGKPLVRVADTAVQRGEWVRLAGASGLGKTTLLRTLRGIWPYYEGHWQLPAGADLFLPQSPYMAELTLAELLAYPLERPVSDDAAQRSLGLVGLERLQNTLQRKVPWSRELSGGEQQRISIARALLHQPSTLYLDEATSQLDEQAASELLLMLRRELPHCTVIGISHQSNVQRLFDRALSLRKAMPASTEDETAALPVA
jgi:putative ATP-binding cassette transporter